MSQPRQRKLNKDESSPPPNFSRSRSVKPPRRLRKVLVVTVLAICGVYFYLFNQSQLLDRLAKSVGYEGEHHYAVIIDAGSTGSRVLAYKMRVPFTLFGPPTLDLVQEYFEQSKPGLSSYADDPSKGAQTIVQLIKKAEFMIPENRRKDTRIIVRATAGLRLLPEAKAQQLIDHVSLAISDLGYAKPPAGEEAVAIMEGSDEGINIWYTVNMLSGMLDKAETMAALDLGGGSTQITYQIPDDDNSVPKEDRHVVQAGKNITLFTHSFLNLGLMAARKGILRLEADNDTTEFTSVCVDPIVQREPWTYGNKQYYISGAARPELMRKPAVFTRCHEVVRKYVMKTLDWEPKEAPRGRVAAMSYFYDVAADAGIIDVMKGGVVPIDSYRGSALKACSASNVEQPWACVDLVYIYTLLHDAYKLSEKKEISLFKKVDGHEVSWALGLAYTTIMKQIVAEVLQAKQ